MISTALIRNFLVIAVLFVSAIEAKRSTYFRALEILETDPIEADALLAASLKESPEPKIRRAAHQQLFFLRLKTGRLVEAFSLATNKSLRKNYHAAIVAALNLSDKNGERLIALARASCHGDSDPAKLVSFLGAKQLSVSTYDFVYRVLKKCRPDEAAQVLPQINLEKTLSKREIALVLLDIRMNLAAGLLGNGKGIFADLKQNAAQLILQDKSVAGQILIMEARVAARNGDFPLLRENCAQINAEPELKKFRPQCRYLGAFAFLKEKKPAEAYALLAGQKSSPVQIDNRLLRLLAGVGAGKLPTEKLRVFMRRASYGECAPMLREMAGEIQK